MRVLKVVTALLAGLTLGCSAEQAKQFVINGDVSSAITNGEVYIWKSADTAKRITEIYRAPVKAGKFTINGNTDFLHEVGLVIEKNGELIGKGNFILEPGNLTLTYGATGVTVVGGKYNEKFINSWKYNQKYLAAVKQFQEFEKTLMQENTSSQAEKRQQYQELKSKVRRIKEDILVSTLSANSPPIEQFLAIQQGAYAGDDSDIREKKLKQLAGAMPDHKQIPIMLRQIERNKQMMANANKIKIGTKIADFSAKGLDGNSIALSDVTKNNKYVLVEFWASWCGPCRAEIPHMKTAYKNFHGKGFEILSFSLDHEKEDWVDASEEEELPWLNTSDLQAYQSPIVQMFGIRGIPANFLVTTDGTIISRDLRQERLDEKLEELL